MIDANEMMEMSFKRRNGFGHLTQGVIDQRRQERRELAKRDLEQQTPGKQPTSLTHSAGDDANRVHRKGTLFGRKKKDETRMGLD
jgi:hypothetical protein